MQYDLIVKGGTVIDPARGTAEVRDLYVRDGLFAEGVPDAGSARAINAAGCYVTPGLIDAHMHLNEGASSMSGRADIICPPGCVTTAIDAGSAGIATLEGFYRNRAAWATTVKAAVGANACGVQNPPHEEMQDPVFVTPEAMRPLFRKYGDFLIGIKIRVHGQVTGQWGLEAVRQSRETARILREEGFRCRRMVHMGPFAKGITLQDVLDLLDAGDVITHIYRPENGATILDGQGAVQECAKEARVRGVVFDTSCGRSHLSFESARKAFADGFPPQIISTDLVNYTFFWPPSGWLALKMSIYLNLGMPLEAVVKAVTLTPASVYGLLGEAGTLDAGKPADIAIFRIEDRPHELKDCYGGSLAIKKLIVPMATIKKGNPVFQQIYLGL